MRTLVANKGDLPGQQVLLSQGQELAAQHNMEFYQTSAKTGQNVNSMLEQFVDKIVMEKLGISRKDYE